MRRLYDLMGLDRAVGFTLIAKAWSVVASPITLFFIAQFLSPVAQGFFYTFGSVLAMKVFFELGLTNVIVNFASHDHANLNHADPAVGHRSRIRLGNLLAVSIKYYAIGAALFILVISLVGCYFFSQAKNGAGPPVDWKGPWLLVCVSEGGILALSPIVAFLQGCDRVVEVLRFRMLESVLANVLSWTILLNGGGLYNACATSVASFVVIGSWLLFRHRKFLSDVLRDGRSSQELDWWVEVFPMQWRIGLSWLLGYFIYQLFNPILFATSGAVVAGKMGMSLNLLNSISGVALAWVVTKTPNFGGLIAKRHWHALDRLFLGSLWRSVLILIMGLVIVCFGQALTIHYGWKINFFTRMLDPLAFGLLALAILANHTTACVAVYLRAHKQEPMLAPTVVGALLTIPGVYFFGRAYHAMGVCSVYMALAWIGVIWSWWLFNTKRRDWHA